MKHVLPLTYEPKIDSVRNGRCIQTIRPKSKFKPKSVGDWVMFHGWEDKPYRSKWNWRTDYWKIIQAIPVRFYPKWIIEYPDTKYAKWIEDREADEIAMKDGFLDYDGLYNYLTKMYGDIEDKLFTVIRWNYNTYKLNLHGSEKE